MKALLSETGVSFEPSGISDAEIYAYAAAMNSVEGQLDETLSQLFYGNQGVYPYRLCKLCGIGEVASPEIFLRHRLSVNGGNYINANLNESLAAMGFRRFGVSPLNKMTVGLRSLDTLRLVGLFYQSYVPFSFKFLYDGSGMSFDEWDEWGKSFDEYDSYILPFSIIDTLRKE